MPDPKDRTEDIKDQEALKEGQSSERQAEIDNIIGGLENAQQSEIANDLGEEMDDKNYFCTGLGNRPIFYGCIMTL